MKLDSGMKDLDERSRGIEILISDVFAMINPTEPFRLLKQVARRILAAIEFEQRGQKVLQECWYSVQRCLTSISAAMASAKRGQRVFSECWRSAQRWLTSISAIMTLAQPGQRGLQEYLGSAQR
jgi:hypothetical protein